MPSLYSRTIIINLIAIFALLSGGVQVMAQTEKELEQQIQQQNEKIEAINKEINKYENELSDTRSQKNTLESTLNSLDNSISSIQTRIRRSEERIQSVEDTISRLENDITKTQTNLDTAKDSLGAAIRALRTANSQTLIETMLAAESLAEAWKRGDQLKQLQSGLQAQIDKTKKLKQKLQKQRKEAKKQRKELSSLRNDLASQQRALISQQKQKQELLEKTNRQEQKYQELLAKKREQKRQFEQQLQQFEQQLQSVVTDENVPDAGDATFAWPVPNITITQQFGGTAFAERNPGAYGRPFHNGTDFGATVGTPINPVMKGTVRAVGNTDKVPGCYSYGKWILVDHNNGLSTLYAHLSSISTQSGDTVSQEDTIGYVGNTGYSTGPHLHLTAYTTDDVRISRLGKIKDDTNCGAAEIPVAPQAGYLNPMKYLP